MIAKPSELRTDKENKIIMERLKEESYFSPLAHNFKELLAISSKVEHRLVKEQQYVYRINEFAECFYVLIEG